MTNGGARPLKDEMDGLIYLSIDTLAFFWHVRKLRRIRRFDERVYLYGAIGEAAKNDSDQDSGVS